MLPRWCGAFSGCAWKDSAYAIANELNRLGTLSPLAYKKYYGLPHAKKGYTDRKDCRWSANTVTRILQDETYTGTLVQGKQTTAEPQG